MEQLNKSKAHHKGPQANSQIKQTDKNTRSLNMKLSQMNIEESAQVAADTERQFIGDILFDENSDYDEEIETGLQEGPTAKIADPADERADQANQNEAMQSHQKNIMCEDEELGFDDQDTNNQGLNQTLYSITDTAADNIPNCNNMHHPHDARVLFQPDQPPLQTYSQTSSENRHLDQQKFEEIKNNIHELSSSSHDQSEEKSHSLSRKFQNTFNSSGIGEQDTQKIQNNNSANTPANNRTSIPDFIPDNAQYYKKGSSLKSERPQSKNSPESDAIIHQNDEMVAHQYQNDDSSSSVDDYKNKIMQKISLSKKFQELIDKNQKDESFQNILKDMISETLNESLQCQTNEARGQEYISQKLGNEMLDEGQGGDEEGAGAHGNMMLNNDEQSKRMNNDVNTSVNLSQISDNSESSIYGTKDYYEYYTRLNLSQRNPKLPKPTYYQSEKLSSEEVNVHSSTMVNSANRQNDITKMEPQEVNVNQISSMDYSFSNNADNTTPGQGQQNNSYQFGAQQRQTSSNVAQAPPYLTNFGHQSLVQSMQDQMGHQQRYRDNSGRQQIISS